MKLVVDGWIITNTNSIKKNSFFDVKCKGCKKRYSIRGISPIGGYIFQKHWDKAEKGCVYCREPMSRKILTLARMLSIREYL
jgi:hypothetical protein